METKKIFLSVAWPYTMRQVQFMNQIQGYFRKMGYSINKMECDQNLKNSTMREVLSIMEKCDGMIVIALNRMVIKDAIIRPDSDLEKTSKYYKASQIIHNQYKTSDWCNIEIGMAFAMNIPILIFLDDCLIHQDIYRDDSIEIITFNLDKHIEQVKENMPEDWVRTIHKWDQKVIANGGGLVWIENKIV